MAGRLIPVPGVVREVPTALRLLRADAAYLRIEQRRGVIEPIHAVFAQDAQQSHSTPHLERAGARALHRLDHLGLVPLGQQPLRPLVAGVLPRDRVEGARDGSEGVLPGDLDKLVLAAAVEEILRPQLGSQLGKTGLDPGFPSFPHDRMPEPVRTVEHSMEGVAFRALAGIPVGRGLIAVQIAVVLIVVGRTASHDDAVPAVGPDSAGMRVVRGTDPVEPGIVAILVVINALPVARDVAR